MHRLWGTHPLHRHRRVLARHRCLKTTASVLKMYLWNHFDHLMVRGFWVLPNGAPAWATRTKLCWQPYSSTPSSATRSTLYLSTLNVPPTPPENLSFSTFSLFVSSFYKLISSLLGFIPQLDYTTTTTTIHHHWSSQSFIRSRHEPEGPTLHHVKKKRSTSSFFTAADLYFHPHSPYMRLTARPAKAEGRDF